MSPENDPVDRYVEYSWYTNTVERVEIDLKTGS